MAIKFIHTGDWHIAKPFGRFDDDKAALLRDARQRIPERIGALARREGATHVLVAGDIFDTALVADDTLRRTVARLGQFADISWHLLPGNHDPATPNGVWRRFRAFNKAANVHVHDEAGAAPLGRGATLLASPLRARHIAHDPTAWMDDDATEPATIRIALAHGSVQGFGSAGDAGVLIRPDRVERARLDYLALGDWHGMKQVGPRCWYAGTPEPDQYPANEPGHVLVVDIPAPGESPHVTPHRLAHYAWSRHVIEHDFAAAIAEIEAELTALGPAAGNVLKAVRCVGRASLDEEAAIHAAIERLRDLAFHIEDDLSALRIDTAKPAGELFDDQITRAVADRLLGRIAAAVGGDDPTAHRALRLLHEIAGRHGGAT